MMRSAIGFVMLASVACVSCGESDDTKSGAAGHSGGGSGGTAGSSSGGAGGGGGTAVGGSGGGTQVCGGLSGATCVASEFCDYLPNECGAGDATGLCTPRPDGCNEIYEPTCACDGTVYGNACVAQQAGFDQNDLGGCPPPDGYVTCGNLFCEGAFSYCEKTTDDTGGPPAYACKNLPDECLGQTACSCFPPASPCSDLCEVSGDGFVLTCPGG
jgi:hypothetical protein